MDYKQIIEKLKASQLEVLTKMQALQQKSEDENRDFTDAEEGQHTEFEKSFDDFQRRIERAASAAKRAGITVTAPQDENPAGGSRALVPTQQKGVTTTQKPGAPAVTRGVRENKPVNLFARAAMALYASNNNRGDAAEIARDVFGDQNLEWMLRQSPKMLQRAAVDVGTTTNPQFAAPLVSIRNATADFIDLLREASVYESLPGVEVEFGRDGLIRMPKMVAGGSSGWIGEGAAIKVTRQAFGELLLSPHKAAAITVATQELLDFSNPSAEDLITRDLIAAGAELIDLSFLDANAATSARPAGIQSYGGTQATAGATLANVMTDVKRAKTALATAKIPMTRPVWIMSETTRIALEQMTDSVGQRAFPEMANGQFQGYPFRASVNVGTILTLIDAAQLIKANDMMPQIELSGHATIHQDDAPVADIGAATTPVLSMFQTDSVAIRCVQRLSWGLRHNAAVFTITGVNYG